jgi:hypothetical protein
MSVAQLDKALLDLLDLVGREALQTLFFDPIEPEELDWYLARLSHRVAPAYLPLAADDSGILALHLWPGRDVAASPFVYIGEDQLELHYLCDGLHNLPVALWLWMGRYFKKGKLPVLRRAVAEMAARIPGGRSVPEPLWSLLESAPDYEPTWWYANTEETTERAWQLAEVGHPFVGVPQPVRNAEAEEALALLAPFVRAHREPELVGLLLAAQLEAGREVDREDVLFVLGAQAWRQSGCLLGGRWLPKARGLCTWDLVLRNLPDRGMLAGTPFAALIDHPLAYSGEDGEGPLALGRVALAFRERGDPAAALRQFHNALSVALLALGGYPTELVLASTATCDAVAPGSLAAAVARRSAEIDREDL